MTRRSFRPRKKRSGAATRFHLATGQQELLQLTLGTPSGTFVGAQIPLIPTFEPASRLGQLALQYSQYSIEKSVVRFVSQTTTNSSGRVILAWTFDALDSNPTSIHQIFQIAQSRITPVWRNTSTRMSRGSPEKRRFPVIDAASFTGLSSADKQMYVPATLVYGTDGSAQSGLIIGSLVWHYVIRFYNPNVQTLPDGLASSNTLSTIAEHPPVSPPHDDDESPPHASLHWSFCKVPYCKYHYFL